MRQCVVHQRVLGESAVSRGCHHFRVPAPMFFDRIGKTGGHEQITPIHLGVIQGDVEILLVLGDEPYDGKADALHSFRSTVFAHLTYQHIDDAKPQGLVKQHLGQLESPV